MVHPPTRLAVLCERVVESGWLAALVVTPLLFNLQSGNAFELDKAACLRVIVVIMLTAWALREVEGVSRPASPTVQRRAFKPTLGRAAQAVPVLALLGFAVDVVAAHFSVVPHLSVWGSDRHQGIITTSGYLVVFLAILRFLRRSEQVERVVTTVLLSSVPVCFYGIGQHFGFDPLPWVEFSRAASSTMGNPIFTGAYLIMAIPLAIYRVLAARQVTPSGAAVGPFEIARRFAVYGLILSAQLLCLFFSGSRGPWMGLAAGLFFFALCRMISLARQGAAKVVIAAGLAMVLVLGALNLAGPDHLPILRDLPQVRRMAQLTEGTGGVRLLIWEAAGRLVTANHLRAIVGHGPETMGLLALPHLPPAVGLFDRRWARADRAHNDTWDALIATGVLGATARLLLLGALFSWGLRLLGLGPAGAQRRRAILRHWFAGVLCAFVVAVVVNDSWRFVGSALVPGGLLGIFVYLGLRAWHRHRNRPAAGAPAAHLIAITALSAIVAHLVEVQVGIAVTATRLHFWTYLAVLVVVPRAYRRRSTISTERLPLPRGALSPWRHRRVTVTSLLASLQMMTLLYAFHTGIADAGALPSVLWILAATWIVGGLLTVTEAHEPSGDAVAAVPPLRTWGVYTRLTLGTVLLAVAAVSLVVSSSGVDITSTPLPFYVVVALAVIGIGGVLGLDGRLPSPRFTTATVCVAPALVVAGAAVVLLGSVRVVQAAVAHYRAGILSAVSSDLAVPLARRAVALQPAHDLYQRGLGQVLALDARHLADGGADMRWREAETRMLLADQLNPLDPEHAVGLARFYDLWAERTTASDLRADRHRQALDWYAEATVRSPNNVLHWNLLGAAQFRSRDYDGALRTFQQSLTLESRFADTYLHLGDVHHARGEWHRAAQAYQEALRRDPDSDHGQRGLAAVNARIRGGS